MNSLHPNLKWTVKCVKEGGYLDIWLMIENGKIEWKSYKKTLAVYVPHWQNQACRRENLVQDVEHIFCTCYKVRVAWQWTRRKILDFLPDQGRPPDISDTDILLAMFSKGRQDAECTLLLGTYLELVDREVVLKQKELLVNTVIGVLKTKTESARRRAVPQMLITLP